MARIRLESKKTLDNTLYIISGESGKQQKQTHYQMLCQVQVMMEEHDAPTKILVPDGATRAAAIYREMRYGTFYTKMGLVDFIL